MSDESSDLPGTSSQPDVILISDPSAEGEAIASALRSRGYVVVDAPLALLEARVIGESPRVIILDVDQGGAFETAERLRELSAGANAELICVGDPTRAAELGATRAAGRAFERPVDVELLAAQVAAIAAPADPAEHSIRGTTPPPSYAPRRETSPPAARDSESPAASEFPRTADPLDVASILPGLDEPIGAPKLLPTQLSPELEQLLAYAEQRVVGATHTSSIPSPDEEVDLILSPELLAALDEPLEPDEAEEGTGSGLGAGTPMPAQVGTQRGVTASGSQAGGTHAGTQGGGRTTAGDLPSEAIERGGAVELTGAAHSTSPTSSQLGATSAIDYDPSGGDPGLRVDDSPQTELFDPTSMQPWARTPVPRLLEPFISTRADPADPFSVAAGRVGGPPVEQGRGSRLTDSRPAHGRPSAPIHYAPPSERAAVQIPAVLGEGDAALAIAQAIAGRASGSLAMNTEAGLRRIVLHDGDIVTAGSGIGEETLVAFLAARGDIERDLAARLVGKLPPFGRHAGAALIAYGHLGQDDLWPVLRAHAEWIIGRAVTAESGTCELEHEPPGRLRAEPSVFGGATGAEVFVETVRRVVPSEVAMRRLGGHGARLDEGRRMSLLGECALRADEEELVRSAPGRTVAEVTGTAPPSRGGTTQPEPELANLIYALAALEVLTALSPSVTDHAGGAPSPDPLDEEALRQRVRARIALVEDGDYFAVLGIARGATSYEIRRAYLELRRGFEPSRLLTAATADLVDDLRTVVEVLDEAYEILREPHRRERYRRAIEAGPP